MRLMLEEAARKQLENSYQTTLVAVSLVPSEHHVISDIILCGDSAIFVFDPGTGELLTSSISWQGESSKSSEDEDNLSERIRFGPGDELLVKVIGKASDQPLNAEKVQIQSKSARNWLICKPLDHSDSAIATNKPTREQSESWLEKDDLLFRQSLQICVKRSMRNARHLSQNKAKQYQE